MKHSSRPTRGADAGLCGAALLASAAFGGLARPACAEDAPMASGQDGAPPPTPAAAPARLLINTTGRTISLTVPLKDGVYQLGDILLSIDPADRISFDTRRTLELLVEVLDAMALERLRDQWADQATLNLDSFAGTGVAATYDPQRLELVLTIDPALRAARGVSVATLDRAQSGSFHRPATVSAYLNARSALDWEHDTDDGLGDPTVFLDGAARTRGIVLETEAVWRPGAQQRWRRLGSRIVHDDLERVVRWTAGDLNAVGRGFQAAPDLAGVSVFRAYGVLQPQYVARPRGDKTFALSRPSMVEVFVNGALVRRLRLDPGTYNLRDFPFTQGANEVVLAIEDDAGARQSLRFNTFFDRSQLQPGLSEFGLWAGVSAPVGPHGPDYTRNPAVSGFYRRGVNDSLTLGGNVQADARTRLVGLEGVFGGRLGTVGLDLAASSTTGLGQGAAATLTFQRQFQLSGGRASALNLSFDARSRWFGALSTLSPDNPFAYETGVSYTRALNDRLYGALYVRFSKGRGANADISAYRASLEWRASSKVGVTIEAVYDDSQSRRNLGVMLSMTTRLTASASARGDWDSRDRHARLSYQAARGQGVGSYTVAADFDRTPDAVGVNGSLSYLANRAELGVSHFSTFDTDFGAAKGRRTSFRAAAAVGFADGAWSLGRPIYDAFAIIRPYETLRGTEVVVNPTSFGYSGSTGRLGTALETGLGAYSERVVIVDAPGAPAGYDLGAGAFRLAPPYRGGYRLDVGSAYSVTAIGRLLDHDGQPIRLLAGALIELARPRRKPVQIFTNRDGRFGASGLGPGKWRIEMPTTPPSAFDLEIAPRTVGAAHVGELRPNGGGR